ncbi:MAG: HAD-IIB family hydrolase [Hespellia sp.]|nr:HAD-IIB family hydrolase [Hespellia sp.]
MDKKYFFFDIDGTLTDNATKKMVPSALEAVHKLMEAGHFVSLATGRANYKAEGFRAKYDFPNMVCNGGHGIFYDGELRENRPIDYDKSLAIYRQALDLGYGVLVAIDDSEKVYANSFRFYETAGIRKEATTYIINENFDPANEEHIFKLYVAIPKEDEHLLTLKDTVGHLRFQNEYLMFQADAKKEGILKMLEYAGGSPKDVVVFGDDYNDLCMFDEQFYCVAMGNACDALKEKADFVAEKNVEDGIYKACESHGWF